MLSLTPLAASSSLVLGVFLLPQNVMQIDTLYTHDLSDDIARLPRRTGAQAHPVRTALDFATFHFSDVVYADRSEDAELRTLIAEARYQLGKNWQTDPRKRPIYGSAYMYDTAVLSSGAVVKLQQRPVVLWHCRNALGNASSAAIHVPLGRGQDLTEAQRVRLFRVFDAYRADGAFSRQAVVSHCEWPAEQGQPRPLNTYVPQRGQSYCPGVLLHRHVAAYRLATDGLAALHTFWVRPDTTANIRASAALGATVLGKLQPGSRWEGVERAGETVTQGGMTSDRWVVAIDGRAVWRPLFR